MEFTFLAAGRAGAEDALDLVPRWKRQQNMVKIKDRLRKFQVLPQAGIRSLPREYSSSTDCIRMYAIETKKRKFDRILDSIQDHSPLQSHTSLTPRNKNSSTISLVANDGQSTAAKKLRLSSDTSSSKSNATTSSTTPRTPNYLPTSREAFLDRLETFRPIIKWHIASNEVINAAAWARRGWRCVGPDTAACGACEERLLVKIDKDDEQTRSPSPGPETSGESASTQDEENSYVMASEIHAGIIAKYHELITTAHNENCPWRRRACIDSIQRIEGLLNAPNAMSMLQIRYDGLVASLPGLDIPTVCIGVDDSERYATTYHSLLSKVSQIDPRPNENAYLLAVCGWQRAVEQGSDVIECRYCFRHLGLWLYRGNEPAMEKLDALDSHLEYCPWRSSEAQATEVYMNGTKVTVPGWILVAQAVERQKAASSGPIAGTLRAGAEAASVPQDATYTEAIEVGGKDRETKMKDLLRRVKELKKPFNVKGLLRRNKKAT